VGSSTARRRSGWFAALGASACRVAPLLPSLAFASSPCPGEARDPALPWPGVFAVDGDMRVTEGMEERGYLLQHGHQGLGSLRDV